MNTEHRCSLINQQLKVQFFLTLVTLDGVFVFNELHDPLNHQNMRKIICYILNREEQNIKLG